MVTNGQMEAPIAAVELQFEFGELTSRGNCLVLTKLTSPLIGLLSLERNSPILDMRHAILKIPLLSMQFKNEDRTYPNVIEPIINLVETILQPGKWTTNWVNSQMYTNNEATEMFQHSPLLETIEDLLNCPALSSTQNNKSIVQISNFLDHPYTFKKERNSKFLEINSWRNKKMRPFNPTSVRLLLKNNNNDAFHYICSFLKSSKIDEVNKTYWV